LSAFSAPHGRTAFYAGTQTVGEVSSEAQRKMTKGGSLRLCLITNKACHPGLVAAKRSEDGRATMIWHPGALARPGTHPDTIEISKWFPDRALRAKWYHQQGRVRDDRVGR
jgi:hypothetical protein